MLKIALDLDNCILDTPTTIINLHNRLNKNKLEYKQGDTLTWKFRPLIKTDEELAELFKLFDHEDFYKDPVVLDKAIEVINTLSMQNKVVIISKHMESRKKLTREWISRVFPTVDLIFVDNFEDKGRLLKDFDIALDDRLDAIESCEGIVKHCLVFGRYDWNKEYTGLKINSWLEFKQFIDKLQKLDSK